MMKAQDHENLGGGGLLQPPRLVGSRTQPPSVTRQGDMDVLVVDCGFDMCKTGFAEDNNPSCVHIHRVVPQHQDWWVRGRRTATWRARSKEGSVSRPRSAPWSRASSPILMTWGRSGSTIPPTRRMCPLEMGA